MIYVLIATLMTPNLLALSPSSRMKTKYSKKTKMRKKGSSPNNGAVVTKTPSGQNNKNELATNGYHPDHSSTTSSSPPLRPQSTHLNPLTKSKGSFTSHSSLSSFPSPTEHPRAESTPPFSWMSTSSEDNAEPPRYQGGRRNGWITTGRTRTGALSSLIPLDKSLIQAGADGEMLADLLIHPMTKNAVPFISKPFEIYDAPWMTDYLKKQTKGELKIQLIPERKKGTVQVSHYFWSQKSVQPTYVLVDRKTKTLYIPQKLWEFLDEYRMLSAFLIDSVEKKFTPFTKTFNIDITGWIRAHRNIYHAEITNTDNTKNLTNLTINAESFKSLFGKISSQQKIVESHTINTTQVELHEKLFKLTALMHKIRKNHKHKIRVIGDVSDLRTQLELSGLEAYLNKWFEFSGKARSSILTPDNVDTLLRGVNITLQEDLFDSESRLLTISA